MPITFGAERQLKSCMERRPHLASSLLAEPPAALHGRSQQLGLMTTQGPEGRWCQPEHPAPVLGLGVNEQEGHQGQEVGSITQEGSIHGDHAGHAAQAVYGAEVHGFTDAMLRDLQWSLLQGTAMVG